MRLELSGWTTALTQAGIASSGTADSFLKASHLTRTRHAHQLSVLALSKLQQDDFLQTEGPHDESTRETWRQAMISPTFQYWDTILKNPLMRHGGSCSARRIKPWKLFHQLRMLCYSTVNVLPTKLGSGQPVNWTLDKESDA